MMAISENKININNISSHSDKNKMATIHLGLDITNIGQLETIMSRIKRIQGIYSVERLTTLAENEETKQAVLVDPGDDGDRIMDVVKKYGLTIDAILLTHGHADHISGLKEVREGTKAKVYIAAGDADRLTHSTSMFFPGPAKNYGAADVIVKDGDEFEAAGLRFKVLATPGHTPGGVCYVVEDAVFCGDTIFAESIGRTDLPGGNYEELLQSIKEKILPLKDDMMLLPGHGPATNVGWERKRNPFLQ